LKRENVSAIRRKRGSVAAASSGGGGKSAARVIARAGGGFAAEGRLKDGGSCNKLLQRLALQINLGTSRDKLTITATLDACDRMYIFAARGTATLLIGNCMAGATHCPQLHCDPAQFQLPICSARAVRRTPAQLTQRACMTLERHLAEGQENLPSRSVRSGIHATRSCRNHEEHLRGSGWE
jgi:hypothetical protein